MRLSEIFRRQSATDQAFETLETSLSEMLLVDMAPQPTSDENEVVVEQGGEAAEPEAPEERLEENEIELEAVQDGEDSQPDPGSRVTAYTQTRLAEFGAFENLQHGLQADLEMVSGALAKIKSAQHQTREFLNGVHSSLHRANELELSVTKLTAENRLLYRQAEHVKRLRSRHEALVEAYKNRESKLLENAGSLRAALAAAKLELVEAQSGIATLESERQETMNALAAAATQAERVARENEILREKHINLAADLEAVSRKRTEAERRVDEFAAIHTRDTAEMAEMRSKTAGGEAERLRLQKQNDTLQARLTEVTEALAALETEMEEQAARHDLGLTSLKNERDTLMARLDVLSRAEIEAGERIGSLNDSLNESNSERRILEERIAVLMRERDEEAARRRGTAELEQENKRLEALVQAMSAVAPTASANGTQHSPTTKKLTKVNGSAAPEAALPPSELIINEQTPAAP